jgi:formylglycine-generating enzyme required for sulfatase activity
MSKIFLSYRRQDSAGIAGRIYDRLRAHFGDDAIFMDIDSIPLGVDFQEHIDAAVGQCDVFLAVIGTKWTGETDTHRRLEDPRDFVRIEIESALQRDIPVIPILIDHARMPTEADVPPSLARLTYRNAIDVDQGRDFHHHVDRLVRGIEFHFQRAKEAGQRSKPSLPRPGQEHKNSIGMKLIRIDAGEFLMGSTKDQIDRLVKVFPDSEREWFDHEQPQHAVKISQPFLLGMHPVTQGQYEAVMGNNRRHFKGSNDLPVENVSWIDAVTFCNKLSEREGMPPCYRINGDTVSNVGGSGYRLPTEAEWEFACRAGSASLFPWGDAPETLGEHAWYKDNSSGQTHPVGQKKPNAWGLHDMLGNVWEWCSDWYDKTYYASSPGSDPPGPPSASVRVYRGGGWGNYPRGARSAYRDRYEPGYRHYYLGFRLALVQSGR